jgi:hypothetical protein
MDKENMIHAYIYMYIHISMDYIYSMCYYSAIRKNEILSFAAKWMKLEDIILNKRSQTQKDKHCTFSLICGNLKTKEDALKVEEGLLGSGKGSEG